MIRTAGRVLYGCYAWVAMLVLVLPTSALLAITPTLARRRQLARACARLFFLAIGSPVRVEGPSLEPHCPCVLVANHSSYLDGIILTAVLPPRFTYLIKHEMRSVPIAGFVLRRLGSAFVNRENVRDRHRIARELHALAARGDALGFFPEGTFDASPGLKPFQLGAFSAAARGKLPIVPIVIRGARQKLPSKQLLPAPGPLLVRVCEPLLPAAESSARALAAATRIAMLEHLDEPDLAPPVVTVEPVVAPDDAEPPTLGEAPPYMPL